MTIAGVSETTTSRVEPSAAVLSLRSHIESRFSLASLETSPFPHIIIEDFFPAEMYSRILDCNPFKKNAGSEWLSRNMSANNSSRTPYYARKQINFHLNDSFDASEDERELWDDIKNCFLQGDWFERLVQSKYREYFNVRFGDAPQDPTFFSLLRKELFLQRHDPGYYIGPHTDIPTRIFTCIFSFASMLGFEDYGTEFLTHRDPLARCWGNDHYNPDDFVVGKVAPYKPNNFLLFFKTRHSFHSVKAITVDVPNERFGMQFQLYEPQGGVFRELSTPDLMAVRMKTVPGAKIKAFAKKLLRRS